MFSRIMVQPHTHFNHKLSSCEIYSLVMGNEASKEGEGCLIFLSGLL